MRKVHISPKEPAAKVSLECDQCEKTFQHPSRLRLHKIDAHGQYEKIERKEKGPFICEHCGMTLKSGVNFINILLAPYFVQKCFAQIFSYYSLALIFFGKIILAQRLLVRCWWNWLQLAFSSITCCLAPKEKSHFLARSVTNHTFIVICSRGISLLHTRRRRQNNSLLAPIVANAMLSRFYMRNTEEWLTGRWQKCFIAHNVVNRSCVNTYWKDTSEKLTWSNVMTIRQATTRRLLKRQILKVPRSDFIFSLIF